ncbi:MAG: STAS domain-containing protein [candidate division KSB1 bacterium]|nr:STAS domain-containing protein [candidate division KSB1 bacterium]
MTYKTILCSDVNGIKVVEVLERRIYLTITEVFKEEMLSIIEGGCNCLLVDLNRVAVMNSAGLGVLLLARDQLHKRGGTIKLVRLQPLLREIFSRMRLDTLFDIYDSREEALRGIGQ